MCFRSIYWLMQLSLVAWGLLALCLVACIISALAMLLMIRRKPSSPIFCYMRRHWRLLGNGTLRKRKWDWETTIKKQHTWDLASGQ